MNKDIMHIKLSVLALVIGVLAFSSVRAQAPNPPAQLCIGTSCSSTAAAYIVSVNGSIVTTRKVSSGQTWTGTTITGSAIGAGPGDIIEFSAGTYPPMNFNSIIGSAADPIIIRGPQSGTAPAIFRRAAPGTGGFIIYVRNCHYFRLDGYLPGATRGCGIKIMYPPGRTTADKDSCSGYLMFSGLTNVSGMNISDNFTIRYVEIDGGYTPATASLTADPGIGMQINDGQPSGGSLWFSRDRFGGEYIEKCIFEYNYLHNLRTEGMYLGPNYLVDDKRIPLKDIIVRHNRVEDTGWDAIQVKMWWGRTDSTWNLIHDNEVINSGLNTLSGDLHQQSGLSILSGVGDLYNNTAVDSGGQGIINYNTVPYNTIIPGSPASYGPYTVFLSKIYNNVVARCGMVVPNNGSGIVVNGESGVSVTGHIYNNTVTGCVKHGIQLSAASWARNNIVLNNTNSFSLNGGTQAENLVSTSAVLTNYFTNPGADVYRLKAPQLAVDSPTLDDVSAVDIEGTPRTTPDKGAYEY